MNIPTIIILVLVAVGAWFAFKYMRQHKNCSCEGCDRPCCHRK